MATLGARLHDPGIRQRDAANPGVLSRNLKYNADWPPKTTACPVNRAVSHRKNGKSPVPTAIACTWRLLKNWCVLEDASINLRLVDDAG
jgi:hypothetical protein